MMKKFFSLIAITLFIATICKAQVPQAFSYQAVIRNNSNALVANQTVSERISLIKDSTNGIVVYSEMQSTKTNANGLVSLQIGTGNVISGTFSGINWATGTYFIKIETDPTGGNNYTLSNTTQLLSVPYALQAGSAPSLDYPDGILGAIPVIIDSSNKDYTVPPGKNFYLTFVSDDFAFGINSDTINNGTYNTIILSSGNVISSKVQTGFYNGDQYSTITGYIVDKKVDPIYQNLTNSSYTVPIGKTFVLLCSMSTPSGSYNFPSINGSPLEWGTVNSPILFPSGTVFKGAGVIINGYLR